MENQAQHDAIAALESAAQARDTAAARLTTPWWYHVCLGLLVAGLVILLGLASTVVLFVGLALYAVGLGVLVGAYKATTGVWLSGQRAGPAARWSYLLAGVYLLCLLVALGFGKFGELNWPVWAAAAVIFLTTVVLGRRYDDALRTQLRGGL